jgi:hypothetical protein
MANRLERTVGELNFEAGSTKTIDLPRSHFYERLQLLVDWDITVNTASTPQNGAGLLDLIEDISVKFNGSQTPKSTGLATSHYIDTYQYGTRPVFEDIDLSTASQQTGQVQTFVDFTVAPGTLSTMLPSFRFSDLTLSVKWGTDSSIADDVTINDATVTVQSRERKKRSVVGNRQASSVSQVVDNLMGFKETERRKTLDVAGGTDIELPKGNAYYAIPVLVFDADSPSNSLVERVVLEEDGVSTHLDTTFALARAQDKQEYGVESRPTGFAYLNYGLYGDMSDIVRTEEMDAFELTVDTEGTSPTDPAEVRYVTQEVVMNN